MNRVVHFEIQVNDPEKAIEFYTTVFGWKIEKWEGGNMEYWMIMTGAPMMGGDTTSPDAEMQAGGMGINGGLLRRPMPLANGACGANAWVCTVVVDNYDNTAEKILSAGGTSVMPKFAIAGMAWQGYFLDTEGNTFGIHQADMEAK